MIGDLDNKKILITGANGQLGRALSLHLLREGAKLYITDIHADIEESLLKDLQTEALSNYQYFTMDVRSQSSVKAVKERIGEPVDVLINNAGVSVFTDFSLRTEEEIDFVMDVNIKGTILCSQVFSEGMKETKSGRIINIASIYGMVPPDAKIYGDSGRNNSEIYGATKAAVIQLTKYLATHLGSYGITSNCVSPGGIFNNQKEFFVNNYIKKNPLGRMADPADFYGLLSFLCSESSAYITGQNIAVDGGFTLNQ
jgi:NAD(P)-dependent dehydrogenase (short-subunit alcohol dehydrogenase family)